MLPIKSAQQTVYASTPTEVYKKCTNLARNQSVFKADS
jgi:hypothetical protein